MQEPILEQREKEKGSQKEPMIKNEMDGHGKTKMTIEKPENQNKNREDESWLDSIFGLLSTLFMVAMVLIAIPVYIAFFLVLIYILIGVFFAVKLLLISVF